MEFTYQNAAEKEGQQPTFDPLSSTFTLTTNNATDIYRTPPSHDIFNGVTLTTKIPLAAFRRMRVKAAAPWKHLYDQAGLIFILPPSPKDPPYTRTRWIKAGIEYTEGMTWASVVSANPWSDWSIAPFGEQEITIEFDRHKNSLWIYVVKGAQRQPLRELTWVFDDEDGRELSLGVYTCKPKPEEGKESLEVRFRGLEIVTRPVP